MKLKFVTIDVKTGADIGKTIEVDAEWDKLTEDEKRELVFLAARNARGEIDG